MSYVCITRDQTVLSLDLLHDCDKRVAVCIMVQFAAVADVTI